VATGYETLRRLTHQNLIPALDRAETIISRLRGISRHQDPSTFLGLRTKQLQDLSEVIKSIKLSAHTILTYIGAEYAQFQAFSSWLRQAIDLQAQESPPAMKEDSSIDHNKILDYIQGPMMKSRLVSLLGLGVANQSGPKDNDVSISSLYDYYSQDLRAFRLGDHSKTASLSLQNLCDIAQKQFASIRREMISDEKKTVLIGSPVLLPYCSGKDVADLRMNLEVW
jgi:anaphase-promoting complex subunit 4